MPEITITSFESSRTLSILTPMSVFRIFSKLPPVWMTVFCCNVAEDAVFRITAVMVPTSFGYRTEGEIV